MTKMEKVAAQLLRPINPSLILVLGAYTLIWGLWVASPFWSVFHQAPLFATMASISAFHLSSEVFWGVIAIVSGLIISRGALKPKYTNVQTGAVVAFFLWLMISILYFIGDWQSTGGLTAATFAIYSAMVWVNTKVNRATFKK